MQSHRSNYKEYLDEVVLYKDIKPTFDKVEIGSSDMDANYTKIIGRGFYNDCLDELGDVRVLPTCDYNDTWATSFILLDNENLKGHVVDFNKIVANMILGMKKMQKRQKQKQVKQQKKQQRRKAKK